MALPALKLNLAPPSNPWRMNHGPISWTALGAGGLILAASLFWTWKAYREAALAGHKAVDLASQSRGVALEQAKVLTDLRSVDVAKELPRWRLAERILTERALPWSRLTAELERSLVKDVRLKSLHRTRSSDMKVQVKIKGEAKTREAEVAFMNALQKNPVFEQITMEREAELQGGGVDFDYTLSVLSTPPPYAPLPRLARAQAAARPAPQGRTPQALPPKAAPTAPARPVPARPGAAQAPGPRGSAPTPGVQAPRPVVEPGVAVPPPRDPSGRPRQGAPGIPGAPRRAGAEGRREGIR